MPVDLTAMISPPPRSAEPKPKTTRTPRKTRTPNVPQAQERYEGLQELGQTLQLGLAMARQYSDAGAIGMHWDPVAKETAKLADTNPWVAKVTDSLVLVGPLVGLVSAVLPLALQLMANHGMVDTTTLGGMGVVHPSMLEAQMKADMARQAAAAIQAQRAAEQEMREAMALIESTSGEGSAPTPNGTGSYPAAYAE